VPLIRAHSGVVCALALAPPFPRGCSVCAASSAAAASALAGKRTSSNWPLSRCVRACVLNSGTLVDPLPSKHGRELVPTTSLCVFMCVLGGGWGLRERLLELANGARLVCRRPPSPFHAHSPPRSATSSGSASHPCCCTAWPPCAGGTTPASSAATKRWRLWALPTTTQPPPPATTRCCC
jgi:hypothetical protein